MALPIALTDPRGAQVSKVWKGKENRTEPWEWRWGKGVLMAASTQIQMDKHVNRNEYANVQIHIGMVC